MQSKLFTECNTYSDSWWFYGHNESLLLYTYAVLAWFQLHALACFRTIFFDGEKTVKQTEGLSNKGL